MTKCVLLCVKIWKIPLKTTLRCKEGLYFEDIACGLSIKNISQMQGEAIRRHWKFKNVAPAGQAWWALGRPPDPLAFMCNTLFKNIEHAAAKKLINYSWVTFFPFFCFSEVVTGQFLCEFSCRTFHWRRLSLNLRASCWNLKFCISTIHPTEVHID